MRLDHLLSKEMEPVRESSLILRGFVKKRPHMWGLSSAGRAPALHAGGQRFDPARLHYLGYRVT